MKYREIETKYDADKMSFVAFEAFMRELKPLKLVRAAGYDHFYNHPDNSDSFARHRMGPEFNQLTFKRKTTDKNNYIRTEHNISMERHVSQDQITALMAEFGYKYNTSIFKNVFVYLFDKYNFVYYVCYDMELKELGRFVEIEMSEDHAWDSEHHAWKNLLYLEMCLKPLGITAQARMKKSLFEMFKK